MWGRRRSQPNPEPTKELPAAKPSAKEPTAPQKIVSPTGVPSKASGSIGGAGSKPSEPSKPAATTKPSKSTAPTGKTEPKPTASTTAAPTSAPASGSSTSVGDGMEIKGNVTTASNLEVFGVIEGDVNSSGHVEIHKGAMIKGTVTAQTVTVSGTVAGDVNTRGRLFIRSTGEVRGDVMVKSLNVDEGGALAGRCEMTG